MTYITTLPQIYETTLYTSKKKNQGRESIPHNPPKYAATGDIIKVKRSSSISIHLSVYKLQTE